MLDDLPTQFVEHSKFASIFCYPLSSTKKSFGLCLYSLPPDVDTLGQVSNPVVSLPCYELYDILDIKDGVKKYALCSNQQLLAIPGNSIREHNAALQKVSSYHFSVLFMMLIA